MPSEQDELCPFCGNAPEPEADAHYYGISGKSWRLCCPQCGARGPQTANSEEMAHVLWNIRAARRSTPAPAPIDAPDEDEDSAELAGHMATASYNDQSQRDFDAGAQQGWDDASRYYRERER